MGRKTAQKIARSANSAHILAQRNQAGTVQTTATSTSLTGVGTTGSTVTLTLEDPRTVLFTTATASLTGVATTTATVSLIRNGTATSSTSPTAATAATTSFSNTHTTPLAGPTFQAVGQVASGTANLNLSVQRESQWV